MKDCETNDCRKEKRGCKGCYYEENIDKDIEIFRSKNDIYLSEMQSINFLKEMELNCYTKTTYIDVYRHHKAKAIENVLSELEELRKYDIRKIDFKDEHIENMMAKLEYIRTCGDKKELWNYEASFILNVLRKDRVDLENYKQAYELETYERQKFIDDLETWKKIAEKLADKLTDIEDGCKHIPTEICNEYSDGRCIQCVIDLARKEVEKDDN